MAENILFSIVIPTYNRAKIVLKTINSVINQSYKNYEILVVDNCSTDNTKEVLEPLIKEEKIRFIQHDKNYERSKSRNTGMENAKGDFLTFLDSDDIMYPDNLKDAAKFITENKEIKVLHNLYHLINTEGKLIHRYKFPSIKNLHFSISHGNFLSCIGVFMAKEIYSKYRFDLDTELLGVEDWEYWLRVLAQNKLGRINKVNNAIIQHDERTVKQIPVDEVLAKQLMVVEKVQQNEHSLNSYKPYLTRMKASGYIYAAVIANSNNSFHQTLQLLRKSYLIDPKVLFTLRFVSVLRIALIGKFKNMFKPN